MRDILGSVRIHSFWMGTLMLAACSGRDETPEINSPVDYSFFVAGHAYGSTDNYQGGLYDPFLEKLDTINGDDNMEFGVLLGDVVKHSEPKYWDLLDADMKRIKCPFYLAPGNHDVMDSLNLMNRYFDQTEAIWNDHNDLFILLDLNEGDWNVSDEQFSHIEESIADHDASKGNIYVFTHQLFWRDHERYNKIGINSKEGMADTLTFWTRLAPLFQKLECPTYFFAGDVGAFDWATFAFHDELQNLTFIATGMGGAKGDNFIIADVHENKQLSFRLISLDPSKELGALEDY